ncbi:hypothetical protein HYS91_00410 [Candidatus Daviesbacteria bacterium]|nr:hypothetical protein [Candidatus Daviesbacteria bacterium]
MNLITVKKFLITFLLFLETAILFFMVYYSQVFAQSSGNCLKDNIGARVDGLVSTPNLVSDLKTKTGECIIDNAAISPLQEARITKIKSYADLKSIFYDQAKTTSFVEKHPPLVGNKTHSDLDLGALGGKDHLYLIQGDLSITGNISGSSTGIIFVDGNLTIGDPTLPSYKLQYGNDASGLVFVVGKDIRIDKLVSQIDGVMISSGTICTAWDNGVCPQGDVLVNEALVIYGSLISLDESKPIKFKRTLTINTDASEIIKTQFKYLVILKNSFSQDLLISTEIN